MSQDQINESNNRLIVTLQSRIRTLEEEAHINGIQLYTYKTMYTLEKGRVDALNLLLKGEIDKLKKSTI